jgi:hypothetical protein
LGRLKGFIRPSPHSPHEEEDTQQKEDGKKSEYDIAFSGELVHGLHFNRF